jgi:oligopeptide transport system ATP-binding protein
MRRKEGSRLAEVTATEAMQDRILEVKNLKKYYPIRGGVFGRNVGEVKAVDHVSFALKRGEVLGIV